MKTNGTDIYAAQWKRKTRRAVLLQEIMRAYGGEAKLMRHLRVRSEGRLDFPARQTWLNWRNRGQVPLEYVLPLSKILRCSPFALNYEQSETVINRGQGSRPEWAEVVESCKFLNPNIAEKIAEMKR